MRGLTGRGAGNAVSDAQDVMYAAWEAADRRTRVGLARKALAISPLCADAYVLLAEEQAKSIDEALELYKTAVEAGAQALGAGQFKKYAGHFWGLLETRPYMRARAGLASALNALGDLDGAIGHYSEMLELNPNDNQGIRYALAVCLMKKGDVEALKRLFEKYDEDGGALWLYSRALIAFRENGGDDSKANAFASDALRRNKHVPAVLTDARKAKPSNNGYITMGGEDEAAHYAEEWRFAWTATPGAIDWLKTAQAGAGAAETKH